MELEETFAKYDLIRSYYPLRQLRGWEINNSIKNRQDIRKDISGMKICKLQHLDKIMVSITSNQRNEKGRYN